MTDMSAEFVVKSEVLKVDASLGLVFGWGIICKVGGEDYFDLGGAASPGVSDHIPEDVMIKATSDFMANSRTVDDMHDWGDHGQVVHSFPMTAEIAKVFGLTIGDKTGWMVGVKPTPEIFAKFADGTYKGFSIGGTCERDAVDE